MHMIATAMRLVQSLTKRQVYSAFHRINTRTSSHSSSRSLAGNSNSLQTRRSFPARSTGLSAAHPTMSTSWSPTRVRSLQVSLPASSATRSSSGFTLFSTLLTSALVSPLLNSPTRRSIDWDGQSKQYPLGSTVCVHQNNQKISLAYAMGHPLVRTVHRGGNIYYNISKSSMIPHLFICNTLWREFSDGSTRA
jgi:hypothetical protein